MSMSKTVGLVIACGVFALVGCGGNNAGAPPASSGGAGSAAKRESDPAVTPSSGASTSTTSGTTEKGDKGGEQLSDLQMKRRVDSIQEKIPQHKAKFKQLCDGDVAIDIDWPSFGRDKATLENLASNYGVERIVMGFEPVCKDKAGKDAVKAKVKALRLVNVKDKSKVSVVVEGGTVTANLNWSAGGAPGKNEREIAADITRAL